MSYTQPEPTRDESGFVAVVFTEPRPVLHAGAACDKRLFVLAEHVMEQNWFSFQSKRLSAWRRRKGSALS